MGSHSNCSIWKGGGWVMQNKSAVNEMRSRQNPIKTWKNNYFLFGNPYVFIICCCSCTDLSCHIKADVTQGHTVTSCKGVNLSNYGSEGHYYHNILVNPGKTLHTVALNPEAMCLGA